MVNSDFAFWNFPPQYFWSLVHWLHRCGTYGCGGRTICDTCCSLSHPLMDIWAVSISWPLGTGLIWIFAYKYLFSFLSFFFLEAIPRSAIVGSYGYYDPWPITMNPPATWETWVRSLGREKPLEEYMAIHSSILAWRIPTDRGAQWAIVHGVAKSQTWLSD